MEEDPTEHLHPVGQRAPEDHRSVDQQPGDGPVRRPPTDRPDRSAVPEANAQIQQTPNIPQPETGKRLGGPEIPSG